MKILGPKLDYSVPRLAFLRFFRLMWGRSELSLTWIMPGIPKGEMFKQWQLWMWKRWAFSQLWRFPFFDSHIWFVMLFGLSFRLEIGMDESGTGATRRDLYAMENILREDYRQAKANSQ